MEERLNKGKEGREVVIVVRQRNSHGRESLERLVRGSGGDPKNNTR